MIDKSLYAPLRITKTIAKAGIAENFSDLRRDSWLIVAMRERTDTHFDHWAWTIPELDKYAFLNQRDMLCPKTMSVQGQLPDGQWVLYGKLVNVDE
jgi:hypothetical protein